MNLAVDDRWPPLSEWLLLALVVLVPLMKPAIAYPVIFADFVFLLLVAVLGVEIVLRRRRLDWDTSFAVLLLYVLSLAPSLLATPSLGRSLFKLSTEAYLVGLAAVMILVARDETIVKRVVLAWLAATAALIGLAVVALTAFLIAPEGAIYAYSRFHFGTLPPGQYPRLALSFFNANMACNYLTVSLGLLFVAWRQAWLVPKQAWALLAGILVAAATTISPGLGAISLALGTGAWLLTRARSSLVAGTIAAIGFLFAASFTPIIHPTAPFVLGIAGFTLAPSGRFLTWSAAFGEFLRHPIVGHGIGIDAVSVAYRDPSGNLQQLGDAHNMILNIAAQTGLIGLAGLAAVLFHAVQRMCASPVAFGIGSTLLIAFLYHGLTGSFEDTRHLWLLFGLLVAAARLPVSRPDERNHRVGAPSPC